MLYIGEKVGQDGGEAIDIAVDPLEGTNLTAYGQPNSLAVLAFGPKGTLLHAPDTYMMKVATGPLAAGCIHVDASPAENCRCVAKALDRPVEDLVVCILERDRHEDMIREVREAGARIRLISDGDVFGAVATAIEGTGIHLYMGIGGAPEGVLACAAMKCIGGQFMGRFAFRNDDERERAEEMSDCDIDGVLDMDCLVNTDESGVHRHRRHRRRDAARREVLRQGRAHALGRDGRQDRDRALHRDGLPHRRREVLGADGLAPQRALTPRRTRSAARSGGASRRTCARDRERAWLGRYARRGRGGHPAQPPELAARRGRPGVSAGFVSAAAGLRGGVLALVVGVVEAGALEVDADGREDALRVAAALRALGRWSSRRRGG